MIEVSDYSLPDIRLLDDNEQQFSIWIPDKKYIVLGASNNPEESLFIENVREDNIAVLKRPSGGQTVLLTPENLVLSVVLTGERALHPKEAFHDINSLLISSMQEVGIKNLSLMGISDIAILGKKISGSAIYRSRDKLFYHAVINLGEPSSAFERYLKHPPKEPNYRHGRKHVDFIISLNDIGYWGGAEKLVSVITRHFSLALNLIPDNVPDYKC